MRSRGLLFLTAFWFVAVAAVAEDPPQYVTVSDSVVMIQNDDRYYGSNMVCLSLDDGLVFVDAGFFTDRAARFRKDMEGRFGKKTIALLLSHAHLDHFFGMGAFADVPVIAAAAEKGLWDRWVAVDFKGEIEPLIKVFPSVEEARKTVRLSMPSRWVDGEIRLGPPARGRGLLVRVTGGHSAGSVFAYLESEGILVGGDNLQADYFPYFGDPTGDMGVWIDVLKTWEAMEVRKICPGHGSVVGPRYLTAVRTYYEELVSALARLKREGLSVSEAVSHPSLPAGYWPKGAAKPAWFDPAVAALYNSLKVDGTESAPVQEKAERGEAVDITRATQGRGWRIVNRTVTVGEGGAGDERIGAWIRFDERSGQGIAWLEGYPLREGAIEFDVRGKDVQQRSFLGVAFFGADDESYDAIYFRPFNFESPDEARRAHGVQYVSHPDYTWQRLRAERPGQFENAVQPVPDPNGWFHVRVVVAGRTIKVFVNGASEPCLAVDRLSERDGGLIGLWVGNGSGGDFANLVIDRVN